MHPLTPERLVSHSNALFWPSEPPDWLIRWRPGLQTILLTSLQPSAAYFMYELLLPGEAGLQKSLFSCFFSHRAPLPPPGSEEKSENG